MIHCFVSICLYVCVCIYKHMWDNEYRCMYASLMQEHLWDTTLEGQLMVWSSSLVWLRHREIPLSFKAFAAAAAAQRLHKPNIKLFRERGQGEVASSSILNEKIHGLGFHRRNSLMPLYSCFHFIFL